MGMVGVVEESWKRNCREMGWNGNGELKWEWRVGVVWNVDVIWNETGDGKVQCELMKMATATPPADTAPSP